MAGVGTVTLLFTDLVGSTALASSVGDVEVDRIRRAHFATLRAAIASTGGDEVKNLGDGLLVAYRSASDAVEGAVAMQRAVDRANADATVDLAIKVGISVGDVTEEDGDWFGMPVNEAARLWNIRSRRSRTTGVGRPRSPTSRSWRPSSTTRKPRPRCCRWSTSTAGCSSWRTA